MRRQHLGQNAHHRRRLEGDRHVECLVVVGEGRHRHVGATRNVEPIEIRIDQGAHDLPHSVGTIVEADDRVAVLHRRDRLSILGDDHRQHELVGLARLVGLANCLEDVRLLRPLAEDDRAIRELGTIPAAIAVHREITARHARDLRRRSDLPDVVEQLLHVAKG